ncbi:MAG TPA: hypothetical protein P5572_18420, partial [Phycisphaerae bacterium]|nr:hypothetical protein [Phycisphaerae bacterium]
MPKTPSIALATCRVLPEPDPDETLLVSALRAAGADARMLPWDHNGNAPAAADFDLCVLRSTWNYYHAPAAFRDWLHRTAAATHLLNPLPVIEWNLHKQYLRDLEHAGVHIVPTAWVERGQPVDLHSLLYERAWSAVVIKPAVSAGSHRTHRFTRSDIAAGQQCLDGLAADADVMIQPYLRRVESGGERALIWIDGAFTHAVTKSPRFADGVESVSAATPLTDAERAFGVQVIAAAPHADSLLYARVDTMLDDEGRLRLSELEL